MALRGVDVGGCRLLVEEQPGRAATSLDKEMRCSIPWAAAALSFFGLIVPMAGHAAPVAAPRTTQASDTAKRSDREVSPAASALARQVIATADHRGLPFAIVDKQAAQIAVYRADRTLAGVSAALLGQDPGDEIAPGVGERAQSRSLRPGDRTTPAGRFVSETGRNDAGEPVVWIDYAAALSIHRLRAGPGQSERARRLASAGAAEKRFSAGCVVVPVAFYEGVVMPVLGRGRAVIYVMPEVRVISSPE